MTADVARKDGLQDVKLAARNLPAETRVTVQLEGDRQQERDRRLGDRGDVEIEHPIVQPEHDRIVHEKHAECIGLHWIEDAEARLLESEEKGQDRKHDGHAEGSEEEAIDRIIPSPAGPRDINISLLTKIITHSRQPGMRAGIVQAPARFANWPSAVIARGPDHLKPMPAPKTK